MKTIWEDDGTNGPVLICCPPPEKTQPKTFELSDGRRVLAQLWKGELYPMTYANLTQARRAVEKLGPQWRVTGKRPYYATYIGE